MKKYCLSITLILLSFLYNHAQQMPIDFTDSQDNFTGFSGTTFSRTTDPLDASNEVGRFINSGGANFEGSFIDLQRSIDTDTDKIINLRVYPTNNAAHSILVKLEQGTGVDVEVPASIPAGNLNTWVDLSFDYANAVESGTSNVINATGSYGRLTIFIDANRMVAGEYLIDDIDDGSTPTNVNQLDVIYNDLVWSDEFDTAGGVRTPINPNNWFHQTQIPSGGSWFNGEIQHYTDRLTNSFMEGGFLNIKAKRETYSDQGVTKQFTSARLNSKFAFTYGRIDVRAKLPLGEGTFPAIWTLGKNINEAGGFWQPQFGTVNWPACGEIDVMEHGLGATNHVSSALHTPSSFGNTQNFRSKTLVDVANTFYVYSMNWSPDQITFLIDGVPYYTYNPTNNNSSTFPFNEDQYILLNVAMGGIAGAVEAGFNESAMVIDYVRVYQNTAGLNDASLENTIKIYPNPANEQIKIDSIQKIDKVEIYNLLGSRVLVQLENTDSINLSQLKPGVYLVQLFSGDSRVVRKVVVE